MKKVLIIEDEKILRESLAYYFLHEGFNVLTAEDGREGWGLFTSSDDIDAVILDIMLPEIDGWSICKRIRSISDIPVILLTARTDEEDILLGFELGANDYVTKPFKPSILLARVKRLLNQIQQEQIQDRIQMCGIYINKSAHDVSIEGKRIILTNTEFKLLVYLIQHKDQTLTRKTLIKNIWGYCYDGNDQTLTTHVRNLRLKLGGKSKHIVTVIRVGYKFEVNP
ncbi:DNA-binding response regulator [Bacillus thuringiensis serovar yunnanensis]|nr:DNA-binding response regulator [Bacillus thuringiensis serovar yunnanensis]